jgi:hypothetical protein
VMMGYPVAVRSELGVAVVGISVVGISVVGISVVGISVVGISVGLSLAVRLKKARAVARKDRHCEGFWWL